MTKNRSEGKLDTVIGPETGIKGDVQVAGGFRLDGRVEGKLEVQETLLSGPGSLVKGELHCHDAVIAGRVEGDIHAQETVELQSGAHVVGNIRCKGLIIQRDSFFEGNCAMAREGRPPAE
ncbi:polymer-forming cytoskeletal protein [candidate division WOR-3 bacterium]|nr:polymer-forming cytoskeletal protein [candidate division WOR-3 bacterium]